VNIFSSQTYDLQPSTARMEGHPGSKGDMGPSRPIEPGVSDEISSTPTMTAEEEKREKMLIWKIDLHILPFVVLLYLFSFLDRGMQSDSPSFTRC
jgi:hypothetical protein